MTVTVVSCAYGDHTRFAPDWIRAVTSLEPAADGVVITEGNGCDWKHPQAFYLNHAMSQVETEWAWIHDIDDLAFPDALAGLEDVDADVWQMGFERTDGVTHIVPQLTNDEYLASPGNPYVAASAIRVEAFLSVGGYRDLAFQDWDLWRRLASAGATFQTSGRTHFHYRQHEGSRTSTELTSWTRAMNLLEMMEADLASV
jgi:hypothetical protein